MARKILPSSIKGGQRFSLSAEQRANLAKTGRRALTRAQEREIEKLCLDYLILRDFDGEGIPPSPVTEIYKKLKTKTFRLMTIVALMANQEQQKHRVIHRELEKVLAKPHSSTLEPVEAVHYALIDLHGAAEKGKKESSKITSRLYEQRGRSTTRSRNSRRRGQLSRQRLPLRRPASRFCIRIWQRSIAARSNA
jgi:hypothetical protein